MPNLLGIEKNPPLLLPSITVGPLDQVEKQKKGEYSGRARRGLRGKETVHSDVLSARQSVC